MTALSRHFGLALVALLVPALATAQHVSVAHAHEKHFGAQQARAGSALAQGNVAGDARPDLLVGAPGDRGTGHPGSVLVFVDGVSPPIELTGVAGATPGRFGAALTSGYVFSLATSGPAQVVFGGPDNDTVIVRTVSGSRTSQVTTTAGQGLGAAVAVADINGDGYDDLFMGAPNAGRVYVVLGNPALAAARNLSTTPADFVIEGTGIGGVLHAGDVNGDSVADVLIGAPSQNAVYLLRGGHALPGTITLPTDADAVFSGIDAGDMAGSSLFVANVDGDAFNDIVIGAVGGDGPGNSRPAGGESYIIWGATAIASRSLSLADVTVHDVVGHGLGTFITAGHLNLDGRADLAWVSPGALGGAGEVHIYYGRPREAIGVDAGGGRRLLDFNDGPDRSVMGSSASAPLQTAIVYECDHPAPNVVAGAPATNGNAGAVYFVASPSLAANPASFTQTMMTGQVATTTVSVINESHVAVSWSVSVQPSGAWLSVTNATGTSEEEAPGSFTLTRSAQMPPGTYTGTVTITSTTIHLVQSVDIPVSLTVTGLGDRMPETSRTDFNGDGRMDLLWQDTAEGYIAVWTMDGLVLRGSDLVTPARVSDTNWRIAGTGDLTPGGARDGKPDIVWQHDTEGWIAVWTMDGLQLVSSDLTMPNRVSDTNWKIVAVADLNNDGHTDFLWRERTQGWLAAWLLQGTSLVTSVGLSPERIGDTNWVIAGTGDFNGDQKTDIVWQHRVDGWIAVWLMDGVTLLDSLLLAPNRVTDTNWQIQAVGDLNGDGQPDLLWRETAVGWVTAWLMNGLTLNQSVDLSPGQVAVNWRISAPR